MIGCLGPMVGTVVVAVNPPGPSAQMAIAEAAGPCPEDTAFCRERNPPMPTRGDNGLTFKKKFNVVWKVGSAKWICSQGTVGLLSEKLPQWSS